MLFLENNILKFRESWGVLNGGRTKIKTNAGNVISENML